MFKLCQYSDYAAKWTNGVRLLTVVGVLSSPPRPDQFWGTHSLLSNGYPG